MKLHGKVRPQSEYFTFQSSNTEVLAWLIEKVTKKWVTDYFLENLWSKLGQNNDGAVLVDNLGLFDNWGAGAAVGLRDAARFGEMMRNGGKNATGHYVVISEKIVTDIMRGGTKVNVDQFSDAPNGLRYENCLVTHDPKCTWDEKNDMPKNLPSMKYLEELDLEKEYPDGIEGMVYRSQYWVVPNFVFSQVGIFGQFVTVFPKSDLVIKFVSPTAPVDTQYNNYSMLFSIAAKLEGMPK